MQELLSKAQLEKGLTPSSTASRGVGLESTSKEKGGILTGQNNFEAPGSAQVVKKLFFSLYTWNFCL